MTKKLIIVYDFDKTLIEGNMQEYSFFTRANITDRERFWKEEVPSYVKNYSVDKIFAYLQLMITKATEVKASLKKVDIMDDGANLKFFTGVRTWFDRINSYASKESVEVKHYIISSGLKEMILGSDISSYLKGVYACTFIYDEENKAVKPGIVITEESKVHYLLKIKDLEAIPFANIIYVGDGFSDVPCFKEVCKGGGTSICVYSSSRKDVIEFIKTGIINFSAIADYSENSELELFVKERIDKIANKTVEINF